MYRVDGDFREPLEFLNQLSRRLQFMTPAMHGIAGHLMKVAQSSFKSQREPSGAGWAELQKSTQSWRAKNGYNPRRPILVLDGHLKRSIRSAVTSHTAEVGSDLDYAAVHMTGRDSAENPMVARPYLGFAPDTEAVVAGIVLKHLTS